jgi:hypothetical protein
MQGNDVPVFKHSVMKACGERGNYKVQNPSWEDDNHLGG